MLRADVALASSWLSLRHGRGATVVGTTQSRIARARGARLELGGRLVVGYRRPGGGITQQPLTQLTRIALEEGAVLRTTGTVLLAPSVQIAAGPGATVSIGGGTFLNPHTQLLAKERIEIGEDCAISWEVLVVDFGGHRLATSAPRETAPVRIGDRVWVGARATILRGVTVGDGAVVAAGAVVNEDVPPRCLVAGNPARVVRNEVEWQLPGA